MAGEKTSPRISAPERETIREFYRGYDWPPTLTPAPAPEASPERRIKVTAELPPGLSALPLPQGLRDQLSPLPQGYARFLVGSDIVLMNTRTREVLDVVRDVFP